MASKADLTSRTHPGPTITVATSMTSCSTVSVNFTQTEHGNENTRTQNTK